MKSPLVSIIVLALLGGVHAQQDTTSVWKNEVVGSLNLTQASFSNWEQGGENSLAWQVKLDTRFERDTEDWNWTNSGKFELGFAKVAGTEARKSADVIDLESVLTKKLSHLLNPFVAVTGKTQFVSGFQYDNENDTKTKVSRFLDPGYFTQSAGVGYKPNDNFSTRLGFTIKETVTSDFNQYADDLATAEIEKTRIEPGMSSVSNFKQNLHENILYASKLDIFTDFEAVKRIDVLWENRLTMKVTKFINVNVSVDLLYDRDITDKAQVKEVLGIGFTYTLL